MKYRFQYAEEQVVLYVEQEGEGLRVHLPDGSVYPIQCTRLADDLLQISYCPSQTSPPEEGALPSAHPTVGKVGEDVRETMEDAICLFHVPCARTERGIELSWEGRAYVFQPTMGSSVGLLRPALSGHLTAPMVGIVAEVMVEEGEHVEAYQPLAVVEAMKVMATLEAPFAGTVAKIHVRKGERVAHGAPMIDVTPDDPA
jgi:biotin carboxyl carrier protein